MKTQTNINVLAPVVFLSLLFFVSCSKKDSTPAAAPVAKFSYTSTRSFPVPVQFHNNSTNISTPGYSFEWIFGDGTTSTDTHPTHVYTTAGTYNVSLEETGPSGVGSFGDQVVLDGPSPSGTSSRNENAFYSITIQPVFVVTFTDQSSNAGSKHWTFGDGSETTDPGTSFTHTFNANGPFVVQLTATGSGDSDQGSATISF